jgi:hypothetical protein
LKNGRGAQDKGRIFSFKDTSLALCLLSLPLTSFGSSPASPRSRFDLPRLF